MFTTLSQSPAGQDARLHQIGLGLKTLASSALDTVLEGISMLEHHCVTTLYISGISAPGAGIGFASRFLKDSWFLLFLPASLSRFLSFTRVGGYCH